MESVVSRSVLVVEDDEQVLNLITLELENAGYTVHRAVNGGQGIKMALERKPSLVLCDQWLPGVSGTFVHAALRCVEEVSHIPFILMTGDHMPVSERPDCGFVQKPFQRGQVRRLVDETVLSKSATPAAQSQTARN